MGRGLPAIGFGAPDGLGAAPGVAGLTAAAGFTDVAGFTGGAVAATVAGFSATDFATAALVTAGFTAGTAAAPALGTESAIFAAAVLALATVAVAVGAEAFGAAVRTGAADVVEAAEDSTVTEVDAAATSGIETDSEIGAVIREDASGAVMAT